MNSSKGPISYIKFVQHNTNRQDVAHQTVLHQAFQNQVDVILLQEPHCPRNYPTQGYVCLSHPSYHTIPPLKASLSSNIRPRVLAYIRKASGLEFSPRYDICQDPDLQIIEVS